MAFFADIITVNAHILILVYNTGQCLQQEMQVKKQNLSAFAEILQKFKLNTTNTK